MFKLIHLVALALTFGLAANIAHAGIANDIPSCYAANKLPSQSALDRELFVLVDQTTPLDAGLQNLVRENVGRLIKPGTAFVFGSFSSFGQGRYLEILTAGTLENPIADKARDDIGVKLLRSFDACMQSQLGYGLKVAAAALDKALAGSSSDLARSDVMASLKELSGRVRQSSAHDKVVLVVSDMLENSSISSFYAKRNVRPLDPAKEMKSAESTQQLGDFGGARIFVIGAGLVQDNAGGRNKDSGVYRDPKTLGALRQFWEQYFTRSNAQLVEFGTPALVAPVR